MKNTVFVCLSLFILASVLSAQEAAPPAAQTPAPETSAAAPKPKKVKKGKGKKKVKKEEDYENSKYRAVMPSAHTSYRLDSSGNPIQPAAAKKKGKKKKKDGAASEEAAEEKSDEAASSSENKDSDCAGEACKQD